MYTSEASIASMARRSQFRPHATWALRAAGGLLRCSNPMVLAEVHASRPSHPQYSLSACTLVVGLGRASRSIARDAGIDDVVAASRQTTCEQPATTRPPCGDLCRLGPGRTGTPALWSVSSGRAAGIG